MAPRLSVRLCVCLYVVTLIMCSGPDRVTLAVDFTTRDTWYYDLSVSMGGRVTLGDSVSIFSNDLSCRLAGHGDTEDPSALHVRVQTVTVGEMAGDSAEAADIRKMLEAFEIHFSLKEGFPGLVDSVSVLPMKSGQWDLYRHFAKMLPLLPEGRVRPGFSWERDKKVPLVTRHGDAVGQLYQSFRFDSLSLPKSGNRYAYLSWSFSYAVDAHGADTAGLLDDMPAKGTGKGSAVLDIDAGVLRQAQVAFRVPQTSMADVYSVELTEEAKLTLVE